MKNFIKKYPKRIITAFLVILLIAVVGTVNNYPTYGGYANKPREITKRTFKYLEDIYGEGNIFYAEDVPTWFADKVRYSGVYYKAAEDHYIYLVNKGEEGMQDYASAMNTNQDTYSHDDTVVFKIEQFGEGKIEFDSKTYMLEVLRNGKWYCIHTGEIEESLTGEYIELSTGENWEFSIKLAEVREVNDEPIRLQRGKYRLTKPATLKRVIPYGDGKEINRVTKILISCEFVIK